VVSRHDRFYPHTKEKVDYMKNSQFTLDDLMRIGLVGASPSVVSVPIEIPAHLLPAGSGEG